MRPWLVVGGLMGLQALVLWIFKQPLFCECGTIALWEGDIRSAAMSQQIFDWYTFSHIIHGFIFYLMLRYLFPGKSVLWRLCIAVGIEVAWEIAENSTMVIEHYRQQALAAGYTGDSILNSLMDTVAMAAGFLFASRARVGLVVALAIGFELFTLYVIRDNLTLNVINLIYVVPFINEWQAGA